jgi:tRNA G18 (ribose-2'-O)-methylase SpoU
MEKTHLLGTGTITSEQKRLLRETNPFDNRNVADEFKGMSQVAIQTEMQLRAIPLVVITENIVRDMNVGQVVRTANAFCATKVYICGDRSWDRRGSVGSHHYINVERVPHTSIAIQEMRDEGYRIVAAEITPGAKSLATYNWQEKTAIVLGEEGKGVTELALNMCDDVVYIEQSGTVRSLNVAGAFQIMAYMYKLKTGNI